MPSQPPCPAARGPVLSACSSRKKSEKDMTNAMRILADNEICVQKLEMREATLENLFMEVVGI